MYSKVMLSPTQSRKMFAQFATGVCILLTENNQDILKGLTINSFSSLSLEPLLITFALKSQSRFFLEFDQTKIFSMNILSSHQSLLAKRCAMPGGATFLLSEISKQESDYIPNCLVSIFCRVKKACEGGDHIIFICEVLNMLQNTNQEPLIFFDSQYCSVAL